MRLFAIGILLLLLNPLVRAQNTYTHDVQLWAALPCSLEVNRQYFLTIDPQARWTNHGDIFRSLMHTEAGYRPKRWLQFNAGVWYIWRTPANQFRWWGEVVFRTRLKDDTWRWDSRLRVQNDKILRPQDDWANILRWRNQLVYRHKRWQFVPLLHEFFFDLRDQPFYMYRYRFGTGVWYEFTPNMILNANYLFEHNLNRPTLPFAHIFQMQWIVRFQVGNEARPTAAN